MRDEPTTAADPAGSAIPLDAVLAAARQRAARRRARWDESPVPAAVIPPAPPVPGPAPVRGRALKCRVCGRTEPRSGAELLRLARGAWPTCCGQVMPPVLDPPPEPGSAEDPDELPWADRRMAGRRKARVGSRAEVRRGLLAISPDLGLRLVDVSETGAQVRLVAAVRPGEQVELALWPPGTPLAARGPAVVCWCLPVPSGEFRAGMRLRWRLHPDEISLLAE